MSGQAVTCLVLADSGDERGSSYPVPSEWFEGGFSVLDGHIATILPGHIRGNHFHKQRHEIFVVMADDDWSFHWDTGDDTPCQARKFDGTGSVLIKIQPGASHAIRNDGKVPLRIIGLGDVPYEPDKPDAFPRKVT